MKILLLGSGGREHAMAWRLHRDNPDVELFVAPGNAGTAKIGTNLSLSATDLDGLVAWAKKEKPDLTVVGPEAPLCAGVVDRFEQAGLPIFGPTEASARLEGSKVYSKKFLLKYELPTAPGECFSDSASALAYSRKYNTYPQVLKADGLAAGKGVVIAQSAEEAEEAIRQIMDERIFGEAGAQLVIEECSVGREMSVHVITDGVSHVVLPIAQDHKRIGDNDTGLNTGGMGAYAPAPFATDALKAEVSAKIVEPVLAAFRAEGIDFRGILYIGLMWTKSGPSIIEFNVRGGDPETQVMLPIIETPLLDIFQAVGERRLGALKVEFNALHVVSVVMAAAGYPRTPESGTAIKGLDIDLPDATVFHAGTKQDGNAVVTSGGRVLSVTAWAADLATARERAYQRVAKIHFAGSQVRRDIAARLTLE